MTVRFIRDIKHRMTASAGKCSKIESVDETAIARVRIRKQRALSYA